MTSGEIAGAMHASRRMVQRLWARLRHARPGDVVYPARMGRPQDGLPGRAGHAAAVGLHARRRTGASRLEGRIERAPACTCRATKYTASKGQRTGRNAAESRRGASGCGGNVPREHDVHAGFKQLEDGRRFLGYEDDASRRWWFGIFAHAMPASAPAVLDAAIKTHGKPAPVVSGHVIPFYARVRDPQARKGRVREAP